MIQSHKKTIYETLGRESVHPFPARMAPGIAMEVVAQAKKPLRILDPMMGSGTVLAIARSMGHQAVGVDIDPLAVLISRVWTTAIDPDEVRCKATEVMEKARLIFSNMLVRDSYPKNADEETKKFISFWFDSYSRGQLAALSMVIDRVRDETVRNVLWCAFSRLIITKKSGVSLAMDLSHSRPHKSYDRAPVKPYRKYLSSVERVIQNCIDKNSSGRGPATTIYNGDARDLPVDNASVDLVLTSPPYLNAIDYIRCSKFSLIWMGYSIGELRNLRNVSIGAEASKAGLQDDKGIRDIISELKLNPTLGNRNELMLTRYIDDMRNSVNEVARVLKPGGRAVYVVGENTMRGTYIRNSVIVSAVAELVGLRLHERFVRRLPANRRYLPPPSVKGLSHSLNARMRTEVILSFKQPVGC